MGFNRFLFKGVWMHPIFLYGAIALAVWWPGGFNIGPNSSEDWTLLISHSGSQSIFDAMPERLFRDIPVWLGAHLTPYGFQGWQSMMLLMTVIRAALFYEIVRRMVPLSRAFAIACGLIALFHPADSGYFWLNTTGTQFSLVLALAACLAAIIHLESKGWRSLAAMYVFQFLSGFTYSAFVPLMFAIPAGAWVLKWLEGNRRSPMYLARVAAGVVVLLAVEWYVVQHGLGKDGQVADFNGARALHGYLLQASRLVTAFGRIEDGFMPQFLGIAILAGLLIFAAGTWLYRLLDEADPTPAMPARWYVGVVAGLVLLALLAYLPYSVSASREADRRQLLCAGMFIYTAVLFLLYAGVNRYLPKSIAPMAILVFVGILTVLSGLGKRTDLVERYHAVEAVLSAVAETAPGPAPHAFIVINLRDMRAANDILGFYHSGAALIAGLRYMYGTRKISGAFFGMGGERANVTERGLGLYRVSSLVSRPALSHVLKHTAGKDHTLPTANAGGDQKTADRPVANPKKRHKHPRQRQLVPYARIILVDLPVYSEPRLLGQAWLKLQAPNKQVADAIGPLARVGKHPPKTAIMCSMLEPEYRPAYCRSRHGK